LKIIRDSSLLLQNAFKRNKTAKIASIFLAVISWYAIRAAISFETEVTDIPLTIQVDDGWAILERSARTVDIAFRGSKEDIRYLNREDIRVSLDVRGQSLNGLMTLKLDARNVSAPGGARVIYIRPSEVTIRMDQESDKQVPVKVEFLGSTPEGYELEKVVCTPATVQISGPRQRLREVDVIHTAPIDLEGRIRSFRKLKLNLVQPSDTWTARIEPSTVMAEVAIVERSSTLDVESVPVSALVKQGFRPQIDLKGVRVKVTLKSRSELLKNLDRNLIKAYVDCTELDAAASYDLPVRVTTPPGITVVSVTPPTVNITVRE
jgi:YbbR domain-containing protein